MDDGTDPRPETARGSAKRLVRRKDGGEGRVGHLLVPEADRRAINTAARSGRIPKLLASLEAVYGRPSAGERKDPLSELIFTILSQNTTDLNRDRAWASLWRKYPSWEAILAAPRVSVESAIRVGGLAKTKSGVIQRTLRMVRAEQGSCTLDALQSMSMEQVEEYLARFKGVGLKTIRCVQVFSLGQPAFPVDTHIFRVTKRLGLVPEKAGPESAHRIMGALTPAAEVLPFHMNLITLGRRVCKPARPLCGECPLARLCPYPRQAGSQKPMPR